MDKCPQCPICEPDENPCMSIFFDLQRLSYTDDDAVKQLYECFDKNYGNLYEKLNIKLYQDDIKKKVYLPTNERIQDSYNLFIKRGYIHSPTESDNFHNISKLYHLLLHDQFLNVYNNYYKKRFLTKNYPYMSFGKFKKIYKQKTNNNNRIYKKYLKLSKLF